jgi:hypothetical protein
MKHRISMSIKAIAHIVLTREDRYSSAGVFREYHAKKTADRTLFNTITINRRTKL